MTLAITKLENVKERNGRIVAACPACRETGADRSGEHLVIMDSGKWGCIANPGTAGHEHRRRIAQLVGVGAPAGSPPPAFSRSAVKSTCRPSFPAMRTPNAQDLQMIARVRGWPTAEGLEVLAERGLLFMADIYDDGRTWPAWVATDPTRANAQARRLDGEKWSGIDAKAKSLPGTSTARCIGATVIGERPDVRLVEGTPDFCAAPIMAKLAGHDLDQIAFVCVTGAGNSLHADDLPYFAGKRVVIAMHNDADHGKGAKAAHRWALQVHEAGAADVRIFDFSKYRCKDLSDYLIAATTPTPAITPPAPLEAAPNVTQTAPARPLFVPAETPFVDGQCYRRAPATEWPSRLDLYHEDPTGDTRRVHGALVHDSP